MNNGPAMAFDECKPGDMRFCALIVSNMLPEHTSTNAIWLNVKAINENICIFCSYKFRGYVNQNPFTSCLKHISDTRIKKVQKCTFFRNPPSKTREGRMIWRNLISPPASFTVIESDPSNWSDAVMGVSATVSSILPNAHLLHSPAISIPIPTLSLLKNTNCR